MTTEKFLSRAKQLALNILDCGAETLYNLGSTSITHQQEEKYFSIDAFGEEIILDIADVKDIQSDYIETVNERIYY